MEEEHGAPYAVWWFDPNDYSECVGEGLDAEEAVKLAMRMTENLGARMGTTRRVIITDREDYTAFEWRYGEGVTFPETGETTP